MKTCTKCNEVKDENEFHKDKHSKDGLTSRCKTCRTFSAAEWNRNHPKKHAENNRKWHCINRFSSALRKSTNHAKHGEHEHCNATIEELESKFTGSCDHCGISEEEHKIKYGKRLHMDHCHISDDFRGFLCCKCNLGNVLVT